MSKITNGGLTRSVCGSVSIGLADAVQRIVSVRLLANWTGRFVCWNVFGRCDTVI